MSATNEAAQDAAPVSVEALLSALRARGLLAVSAEPVWEVRVTRGGKSFVVRFSEYEWARRDPGTDRHVQVARAGREGDLARWIANELLGQL